jgi:hypothetical protein
MPQISSASERWSVLGFGEGTNRMRDTTGDMDTSDIDTGDIDDDQIDEVDAARSREYALLSTLLSRAPDQPLLDRLADLRGDASPLGRAHAAVAEAAGRTSAGNVQREYFDLFIGSGAGNCCPTGPITSLGSCLTGRSRGCAKTWFGSESSERPVKRSRKITRRSYARSWPAC